MPAPASKKKPISIVERRLKSGSVFTAGSKPIPLTEPDRWTIRIVNSQITDARLWEMQAEKGWVYLEVADLAIQPEEIGFRVQDGKVVRGTHGHEVLMKMPKADYQAIARLKDRENRKNTLGDKAVKAAIVSAADREDQSGRGAEFLDQAVNRIEVKDELERVRLDD